MVPEKLYLILASDYRAFTYFRRQHPDISGQCSYVPNHTALLGRKFTNKNLPTVIVTSSWQSLSQESRAQTEEYLSILGISKENFQWL